MSRFNPLTAEVDDVSKTLDDLGTAIRDLRESIARFDAIEPDDLDRQAAEAIESHRRSEDALFDSRAIIVHLRTQIEVVRSKTFAHTPSRAFTIAGAAMEIASLARSGLRRRQELRALRAELLQQSDREKRLVEAARDTEKALLERQDELERRRQFDRADAVARAAATEAEAAAQRAELSTLLVRAAALDDELRAPTAQYDHTAHELDHLRARLDRADSFGRQLRNAATSRDRARIHQSCQLELGTGNPLQFMKEHRPVMARLERDHHKQERLIDAIVRRNTIDPKRFVIDGSNMCFEGNKIVGLWPLRALHERLVALADVVVFFDSTIVSRLGLRDAGALTSQLPGIDARVVAARIPADETILDEAQDAGTYVISNDQYGEFTYKDAVKGRRVLGFDIHGGRIRVPELRIDSAYFRSN